MKTAELIGSALGWAVAKCEGKEVAYLARRKELPSLTRDCSNDWAQGGPIIEREGISVVYDVELSEVEGRQYRCTTLAIGSDEWQGYGATPLIAAMRCYVASKLGDEVEVPAELA